MRWRATAPAARRKMTGYATDGDVEMIKRH
jgi:hypothetical protein